MKKHDVLLGVGGAASGAGIVAAVGGILSVAMPIAMPLLGGLAAGAAAFLLGREESSQKMDASTTAN